MVEQIHSQSYNIHHPFARVGAVPQALTAHATIEFDEIFGKSHNLSPSERHTNKNKEKLYLINMFSFSLLF